MRKTIFWGVGCLLAGSVLFGAGFAALGGDFRNWSTEPQMELQEYISSGEVQNIRVEEREGAIRVLASPDEQVHVSYYTSERQDYAIDCAGGTLTIRRVDKWKRWDNFLSIDFQESGLTVALPQDFGSISVETTDGEISAEGIRAETMELRTRDGDLSVRESALKGSLSLKTSDSAIEMRRVDAREIHCLTSDGAIRFSELNFEKELRGRTRDANIEGSLQGEVGDYSIRSAVTEGDNTLPSAQDGGDKKVDLQTHDGSIRVDFAGEER